MSTTKVIVVEIRKPTKREKGLYGETVTEDGVTKVFIDSQQSQGEMINTFFHEMAHAFMHWTKQSGKNTKLEESLAQLVGDIVEPCFRRPRK